MRTVVIFDLDGTLLDTSEGIYETANHTMVELGYAELTDSQLRKFVGPPLAACFRIVCGFEEELVPKACDVYREKYVKEEAMYKAKIYAGIEELLQEVKQRGFKTAVATNKTETLAIKILEHFGLSPYFDTICGTTLDGSLSKTDVIKLALKRLGVSDPSYALMVGDTPHDQMGSKEAHVDFVGVDWGFGFSKGHNMLDEEHVLGFIDEPLALLAYL